MQRNVESHFSQLPQANIQRSIFDRSCSYKTSFNAGELIPFYVDEVLPGDTFDISTAKVVRSQTLLTPLMDNMYLDTFYFYVPARLCWTHWMEFCGENSSGPWAPSVEYTIPTIASPSGGFGSGTIADYMGLPIGVEWSATDPLAPSALPFRAYALICDHFFRDENLQSPLLIPTGDANQTGSNGSMADSLANIANGGKPFVANRYHDYFSSALPSPQKGDPVGIPIDVPSGFAGGTFPVTTIPFDTSSPDPGLLNKLYMWRATSGTSGSSWTGSSVANIGTPFVGDLQGLYASESLDKIIYPVSPANLATVIPDSASSSTTAQFTINQFRLAYTMQCYLERLARGGSRYSELLLSLFGVKSPDARLQDPEYLGGNRIPLSVTEATNTAQTELEFLGDVGAKSVSSDVHSDFVKSFTEHGYVIGLMCVRYDHSYSQGLNRMWMRKKFEDFYNPMFANLGEVPVYKAELYATSDTLKDPANIFGYQEIWADYRYKPNLVTGEMRPGVANSLAYWHLSDYYKSEPTLSSGWIPEDKANVDRVLAVSSSVANQFWADIFIRNKCTRCMPMYSIPSLEPKM